MMMSGARSRCAFTATQWQELEHQALVFKYIVSGMPIPPDLLLAIKRSVSGWSYLQMGLGRKIDPEPGRCRRTDGKKWRCSRDAYPDSKYCERHMHRGKNRSRKPVELTTPSTPTHTPSSAKTSSSPSCFLKPASSNSSPSEHSSVTHDNPYSGFGNNTHFPNHFVFPQSTPSTEIVPQHNTTQLLLDSESCAHTDYRSGYMHGGLREEVDERGVFAHSYSRVSKNFSSSSMDDPLHLTPLTINSSLSKQRADASVFEHLPDKEHEDHQQQQQHCYLLGRDLKSQTPSIMERSGEETWLNTQLSMSIPDSSLEFPIFNS